MLGVVDKSVTLPRAVRTGALSGKKVLVVGGTAGIGAGIAKTCAAAGASVTVFGRTQRDASIPFVKADLSLMATAQRVAKEMRAEDCDVLVFTNGIVPGNKREATAEGVEMDMAASALCRYVMLKEIAPRLKPSARVLIWGFPGSDNGGYLAKTTLSDFNSEQNFHGGFEGPHMNTVALNEALVLHFAAQGLRTAGYNPGLVVTDIRKPVHGGGADSCLEACVVRHCASGLLVEEYVNNILYTLSVDFQPGQMFHQSGAPLKQSPQFTPELTAKWIAAAENLAAKDAQRGAGGQRRGQGVANSGKWMQLRRAGGSAAIPQCAH